MLDRIVEVFCEVDDFCQAFVPQWEASLLGTAGRRHVGRSPVCRPARSSRCCLCTRASKTVGYREKPEVLEVDRSTAIRDAQGPEPIAAGAQVWDIPHGF